MTDPKKSSTTQSEGTNPETNPQIQSDINETDEKITDPVSQALNRFAVKWKNSMGEPEEGPLYVLWDLIESYRVDIFDVSLMQITEDFTHFLNSAEDLQIELASSFIVMASRLLFYKSKSLLPDPGFEDSEEEPRLPPELVQQLLEYRKYQMVADKLRKREEIAAGILPREKVTIPEQYTDANLWIDVSLVDLLAAYSKMLQRIEKQNEPEKFYEIQSDEFSVEEKINFIQNHLKTRQSFSFTELFKNMNTINKNELVTVFLALLELTKMGIIILRQKVNFSEIRIFKKSTIVS